nr:hypothetical protein [Tanacetum cinerariifolium]
PTHDINNDQKVNIFYNGLGAINRQLLDSQRPIPSMTSVQALMTIQTMADHSQKWHDGSFSRNIGSSSDSEGIAAIVNKLENLSQDIKKLKENVYAIQVGYFVILDMVDDIRIPIIVGRPLLATAHTKVLSTKEWNLRSL